MQLISHNISFERNQQLLFSRLNFELNSGDFLQIRGTNGCGKSTLLRILADLLPPLEGTVLWQKKPINEHENYQQQLHYLGHQPGIKLNLTVKENLQLSAALLAQAIPLEHFQDVLEQFNLRHVAHTQASCLSAGQLRRLSLARLLLNPAPLWILDEPLTALDVQGQHILTQLLNKHLNDGNIAIIATHHTLQLTGNMKMLEIG